MIVWRNSKTEITQEDIERNAKACALEHRLNYYRFEKFLEHDRIIVIVFCKDGKQLRIEIICDYYFPTPCHSIVFTV